MHLIDKQPFRRKADDVVAMFSDEQYYVRKYQRLGDTEVTVLDYRREGDTVCAKIRRIVNVEDPIPRLARPFFGERMTIVQEDCWDLLKRAGSLKIDLRGIPAMVTGQLALENTSDGCHVRIDLDIRVRVPLIGERLEQLLAGSIKRKLDEDHAVSVALLADY